MSSKTPTSSSGPALLNERSITGIFVHPLALFTGIFGAGLVYLISSHEFTRANARNALNWHLSILILSILAFVTFFLGADQMTIGGDAVQWSPLPAPVDGIVGLLGAALLFAAGFAWLLTVVFALIAMFKAIFGAAWEYPLSRDLVGSDS